MDIATNTLIWLVGWVITVLVIIIADPPKYDDGEVAATVFLALISWPILAIMLFPVYFFKYVLKLRNRYL